VAATAVPSSFMKKEVHMMNEKEHTSGLLPTNKSLIPPIAPHWEKLDLAKILSYPTAFISISQSNGLYDPAGSLSGERQYERGSLEATIKVVKACREAGCSFYWIGYDVFRIQHKYAMTEMDTLQYSSWTEGMNWPDEKMRWDGELTPKLQEMVEPDDECFFEVSHQNSFICTPLRISLAKRNIKTIVFTGCHLDWCIEGNSRAARDEGYMPIVVGDACACSNQADEPAAFQRISSLFAPVIDSDQFLEIMERAKEYRKRSGK